jgi:hypothetical protein
MTSMKWTEADVMAAKKRMNKTELGRVMEEDRRLGEAFAKESKYHAIATEADGIRFQSKKEAKYFRELQARVHLGEVAYFLRQVPFWLKGGVTYRVDFMEVLKEGSIRYVDVKGFKTQTYKIKRRIVEASYPVKIIEV